MSVMRLLKKQLGIILLILTAIIGLVNYDNYGIAWDERDQYEIGITSYNYIFSDSKELLHHKDRDYGVAFELPLIVIEKILKIEDSRAIYLVRHVLTHLFFLVGAFFCFLLIDYMYENKLLASTSFLFIVLYPVFYAHSFFNTKDIPFAAMFVICFYLNARAFSEQKMKYFLLLGVGVGLLINMRIMGVLLFCCVLFFLVVDFFLLKETKIDNKMRTGFLLVFIVAAILTLYVSWPFLWKNPVANFIFAFKNMAQFRWPVGVLFLGEYIKATELPWYYIPVWFVVTTPLFYLFTGFGGILLVLKSFFDDPLALLKNTKARNNLFFLICFFIPIVAVIVLESTLYDGWRQMFFIYPSFVFLAIYGLHFLFGTRWKNVTLIVTYLFFCYISYFMIKNNPFQHLYFNEFISTLPAEYIRIHFEFDYWGVSYRQSLEYILKEDNSSSINVMVANPPGRDNVKILPFQSRTRINIVKEVKDAEYFVTNFRWHPNEYKEFEQKKWHAFKVGNNTYNEIFKLKKY
jgi:hypothetical protein